MLMLPARYKRTANRLRCAELFDLKNRRDLEEYNQLLAQDGRTIQVILRKEWPIPGSVAPANEYGDAAIKDDAYYVCVEYYRTPDCPYIPRHEREQAMATLEITARPAQEPPVMPSPATQAELDIQVERPKRKKGDPPPKTKRRTTGRSSP